MKAINTYMSALFKATLVFLLFTSVILFTSSCNDDDPTGSDPDPTENNESVAVELSSTDPGGTADLDGTSLWIPPNS
ncbi:MAG: hypothetical protein KJO50_11950, partial [Bacteroidia bacterium]|nr:hypothetical protein [Bacteroidia bacterium]